MKHIINIEFNGNVIACFSFKEGEKYVLFDLLDSYINDIAREEDLCPISPHNRFIMYWFEYEGMSIHDKIELFANQDVTYTLRMCITEKDISTESYLF